MSASCSHTDNQYVHPSHQLEPNNPTAYHNRGSLYDRLGDYPSALSDFGRAIQLDGGAALSFNARGLLHERAGRAREALADFDVAVRLDPQNENFLRNRALCHRSHGQLREAIADFTTLLEVRLLSDFHTCSPIQSEAIMSQFHGPACILPTQSMQSLCVCVWGGGGGGGQIKWLKDTLTDRRCYWRGLEVSAIQPPPPPPRPQSGTTSHSSYIKPQVCVYRLSRPDVRKHAHIGIIPLCNCAHVRCPQIMSQLWPIEATFIESSATTSEPLQTTQRQ